MKAEVTSQGAASVTDSGNTRAWLISVKNQAALRKEGCDERRRYGSSGRARASDSVAEIGDGRLLLLSKGETLRKTKREFVTPTKSGAQNARAGAKARSGKSGVSSSVRKRDEERGRKLR
jgi:hypothetical protein